MKRPMPGSPDDAPNEWALNECWLSARDGWDTVPITTEEHGALTERLRELREPKPEEGVKA